MNLSSLKFISDFTLWRNTNSVLFETLPSANLMVVLEANDSLTGNLTSYWVSNHDDLLVVQEQNVQAPPRTVFSQALQAL